MSTAKIIAGMITGFAAGALLGVLFAPDKGSETRKKIIWKGSDILDELKDELADILLGVREELDTVMDAAGDMYEKRTDHAANTNGKPASQ